MIPSFYPKIPLRWGGLLFCLLISHQICLANAYFTSKLPPDTTVTASEACHFSKTTLYSAIDEMSRNMNSNFGLLAHDSIEAVKIHLIQMVNKDNFIITASTAEYRPEEYMTLEKKLASVLQFSSSKPDSIESLCNWIASRYPYGNGDSHSSTRSLDSTWLLLNNGSIEGQCSDYCNFLSKIIDKYFPHWGIPVEFQSWADTLVTHGGHGDPSHIWLGLSNRDGIVEIVCDPTIGGIVRNAENCEPLQLSDILIYLKDSAKVSLLSIQPTVLSYQAMGKCLVRVMLEDTVGMLYYDTPVSIVKAHWQNVNSYNPMRIAYWKALNLPSNTFMNVYLDMRRGWVLSNKDNANIKVLLAKNYGIPIF